MKYTADFVRNILQYDPTTGVFRWRERSDVRASWNPQFAGKRAGSIGSTGYLKVSINDQTFLGHRLAWLIMTGAWPAHEIDHKDGNPANNRWDNLRRATRQQNQQNRRRHKSNKSGFKGVYKNSSGNTWAAQIYDLGRKIHVGNFPSAQAAHKAYCDASHRCYGEFARTT